MNFPLALPLSTRAAAYEPTVTITRTGLFFGRSKALRPDSGTVREVFRRARLAIDPLQAMLRVSGAGPKPRR